MGRSKAFSCCFPSANRNNKRDTGRVGMEMDNLRKDNYADNLAQIANNWQGDVRKIWLRPIKELPVNIDVPRIAHKITISKDGTLIPKGEQAQSPTKSESITNLLCALAEAIYGTEQSSKIREVAKSRFAANDNCNHSKLLSALLQDPSLFPDHRGINALKFCQQKIILPGYYFIKHCIGSNEELRDQRGKWFVHLNVLSNGTVTAKHTKGQRSGNFATDQGDPEFTFDWVLTMQTNINVDLVKDVNITVKEPWFHDSVSKDRRSYLVECLRGNDIVRLGTEKRNLVDEMVSEIVDGVFGNVTQRSRLLAQTSSDDTKNRSNPQS